VITFAAAGMGPLSWRRHIKNRARYTNDYGSCDAVLGRRGAGIEQRLNAAVTDGSSALG
jgi:hypothetical protein